ncbi:MAG: PAS domain-containing sensor histidine kinase [Pseudomonadota bacterium]|nr:PAS domain-containing sensor histidine kinase [Pseudomonadota bacterium]
MFKAKYLIIVLFIVLLYALVALLYLNGRYESATIIIIVTSILFFLQTLRMYFFFKHLIEYFSKDNIYIQPTLYNYFLNPKNEILRIKASLERKNQLLNSELQETKNNYSKLIDSMPLPIIIMSDKKFILFANKFANKAFTPELENSFLYEHFRNFDIPDSFLQEEINSKQIQFNNEIENKNITYKVLLQSLFSDESNPLTFLLIFIDQNQIAKSLREKNDFLANASHELKTPITNIIGITEIINNDPEAIKTNKNFPKHLLNNSLRLKKLIESFLDLSRVEMNKDLAVNQSVNFYEFISEFIKKYVFNNEKKNIKLENNISKRTTLIANSWELELLLNNLLDNCFKYSSSKVSVLINEDKEYINILVKDNGKGISVFDLEKIKERFYRGKGSQNIKGTGLGLSIVDEIIANHKGKLKIESEEKEGTSVSFTLKKTP